MPKDVMCTNGSNYKISINNSYVHSITGSASWIFGGEYNPNDSDSLTVIPPDLRAGHVIKFVITRNGNTLCYLYDGDNNYTTQPPVYRLQTTEFVGGQLENGMFEAMFANVEHLGTDMWLVEYSNYLSIGCLLASLNGQQVECDISTDYFNTRLRATSMISMDGSGDLESMLPVFEGSMVLPDDNGGMALFDIVGILAPEMDEDNNIVWYLGCSGIDHRSCHLGNI